jgi:hypothetical protein
MRESVAGYPASLAPGSLPSAPVRKLYCIGLHWKRSGENEQQRRLNHRWVIWFGKLTMLEIACSQCDRRGPLRLDRLIEEHGAGIGMTVLGEILAGDCPRARSASMTGAGSTSRSCPTCS